MNFCAGCLAPQISSDKPGADGRDVSNLISCDLTTRRKGFMGEYFIRPPVALSLEFSVPIDISHIILGTRLEHMHSTGFAVFTNHDDLTECRQKTKQCGGYSLSRSFESCSPLSFSAPGPSSACSTSFYSHNNSPFQNKEEKTDVAHCLGKFFTQGEDLIYLKNHYYRHLMNIPMPVMGDINQKSKVYNGALRHPNRQALSCVKKLIIKILKTIEKGPPVLFSIEVWGQPGLCIGKQERRQLFKKWASQVKVEDSAPSVPRIYNSDPEKTQKEVPNNKTSNIQDSLDIPEDFLDPLTCDVMTVPLLLPSGQSIDAHTLERFIANEAIWGRSASDPFTGVPFRARFGPTANVPLKARIDRFLLLNADHPEIHRAARTVGSTHSWSSPADSHQDKSKNQQEICSSFNNYNRKRIYEVNKKSVDSDELAYHNKILNVESNNSALNTNLKDHMPVEAAGNKKKKIEDTVHSLEAEIEAVLDGKPKYLPIKKSKSFCVKQKAIDVEEKFPLKNQSVVAKSSASRFRIQAMHHTIELIKKPTQHLSLHGKGTSNSHHGLVQMIGGALSVTHGRTTKTSSIPIHSSGSKPTSLVRGDGKIQNYDHPSYSSITCACSEHQALYRLLCGHIMCRTCLLQTTKGPEVQCGVCRNVCKKLDVSKHHEKSIFL
ncbi:uncharacterized protein [Procambarus clarkii]